MDQNCMLAPEDERNFLCSVQALTQFASHLQRTQSLHFAGACRSGWTHLFHFFPSGYS